MFSRTAAQQRYQLRSALSRSRARLIRTITLISAGLVLLTLMALPLSVPNAQHSRQSRVLSLDDQASSEAHSFWTAKVITCGEDSYTLDRNYVHEFKGKLISVNKTSVSGADRLNGIEWRGFTTITVQQSRTYSPKATLYQNAGWSKWSQGFTSSMGGGELRADLRKEKGRWVITPQLGQAAALKAISCADAANPEALFRNAGNAAVTAEVAAFKDRSAQMWIYASNLPPALWTAMYRVGSPGPNTAYTTLNQVYLTANGGWIVCGRNGCAKDLTIPKEISANRWVEQVTKDGSYLIFDRRPREGLQTQPDFVFSGIPQSLVDQITEYTKRNLYIKMVRIGYFGEWFILAGGEKQCFGCPARDEWTWSNLPPPGDQALKEIADDYNGKSAYTRTPIRDVEFIPNGGYLILYDNRYYGAGVPPEVLKVIDTLRASNRDIDQVTFGPNDSWIIRANGPW